MQSWRKYGRDYNYKIPLHPPFSKGEISINPHSYAKTLLNNEGITESIKNTFLVYLISHNRPIAELLAPRPQDISAMYESEFKGMTYNDVSLEELYHTRDMIVKTIHKGLNKNDRQFLLSLKEGTPKWGLFAFPEAASLPAVRWKLKNLSKMTLQKRKEALHKLEDILKD